MQAVLDRDIILNVISAGGTEVGKPPAGVGLERLRFDGVALVDLMDLSSIWVEPVHGGGFILHAVEVPGAQLVEMRYTDRGNLVMEASGLVRVLALEEIEQRELALQSGMLKASTRKRMTDALGDFPEQLADLTKMVYLLALGVVGKDQAIIDQLQACLTDMAATYDAGLAGASLKKNVGSLRDFMQEYYTKRSDLSTAGMK